MITPDDLDRSFEDIEKRIGARLMPAYDRPMTGMTREELDARLSALADRSDARAREAELKAEGRYTQLELQAEARLGRFEERMDQAIGEMRRDRVEMKAEFSGFRTEMRAQKWQILGGVFGIGVAVVLGIAAFNATVLSSMVASFDTGRQSAEALSVVSQRLDKISERLDRQAAAPVPAIPAK